MTNSSACVLGIDLGTSSIKVVIVDSRGELLASTAQSYPTSHPQPGWAEQNPADWIEALRSALEELRTQAPALLDQLVGIGLTSAAHLPVLLDTQQHVIRPAILWSDQRSEREVTDLRTTHGGLITRKSLNEPGCTWTLPQLRWVWNNEPDVLPRVRCLLSSKDYLLFKLTGAMLMDHGSAAATLMLDAQRRSWSRELTALSALPDAAFPPLLPAMRIAGYITGEARRVFGLPEGVPVIAGTIDSAAELVGCGMLKPDGNGMVRVGSAGGIMAITKEPIFNPGVITYPHVNDGLFYKQAGTNSCATSLQWIRNLCRGIRDDAAQVSYTDLDRLAKLAPPGADGLIFHPYLQGERAPYWNPALRGSFTGLDQRHGWPHLVRAVMEGVAFSLRDCLDMFRREGMDLQSAVVAGGVVESEVWLRIVTDVLDLNTRTVRHGDSVFGAAMLAATAVGMFKDLDQAVSVCVREEKALKPDAARRELYDHAFARYRNVARFFDVTSKARNGCRSSSKSCAGFEQE